MAITTVPEERQRSPRYPSFNLEQVLGAVQKIYAKDRRTATTRDVAASHMGYSGITGSSSRMLGALNYYGLIEDAGQSRIRVSDTAEALLHPKDANERWEKLIEAVRKPKVFSTLLSKHRIDQLPSDETLKTELIREFHFSQDAARDVVKTLKQSLAFIGVSPAISRATEDQKVEETGHPEPPQNDKGVKRFQDHGEEADKPRSEQRIEGKLSSRARVEMQIWGPVGEDELKRLNRWLEEIVTPWAKFQVMETDMEDETA